MAYLPGQQLLGYQTQGFDPSVLPRGSNPDALTIDQVNIAMRASPVWNQWMHSRGIDPGNVHLSSSDKNGLAKTLELNGFPLPEGWEIDNSGNIREETHIGRNILIAAAIAGAAFGGYALLAAYGPEAATGASAEAGAEAGATSGAAAAEGGLLAGTTTAPLAGTLPAGLVSGTSAGGALGGASTAGTLAGSAPLDNVTVDSIAGNYIDPETGQLMIDPANISEGSTYGSIGDVLRDPKTYSELGSAIGRATSQSAQNRQIQQNAGLEGNKQNITGQSAYENQLMSRAELEASQRKQAQRDLYKASVAQHPAVSPFDPTGGPKYSADYLAAMGSLDKQGLQELQQPSVYGSRKLPPLRPYQPINPKDVQGATGKFPGTFEKIGNWVGPALSTYGAVSQYWR